MLLLLFCCTGGLSLCGFDARRVRWKIFHPGKPEHSRQKHHSRDHEEGDVHVRVPADVADNRKSSRIAEEVDDENIQGKKRSPGSRAG